MNTKKISKVVLLICATLLFFSACKTVSWQSTLAKNLPEMGHRNWIVVADAAYPYQNSNGISTIVTNESQVAVLEYVLKEIEATPHVKPIIMVDKELEYISDEDAPGMDNYKAELKRLLQSKEVANMPHVEIIKKLDEESKLFKILLLKTNMTIPYTSVFINLDCDYWTAEKEAALRKRIATENQ